MADLVAQAEQADATAVTTTKDWVRLPPDLRARVETLAVRLAWERPEDEGLIRRLIQPLLAPR